MCFQTSVFCSHCYKFGISSDLVRCADCENRVFCSNECKAKDLKSHQKWCGVKIKPAGEINVHFEVRDTADKGRGVFALVDFKRGDTIMVERAICVSRGEWDEKDVEMISEPSLPTVRMLKPREGSFVEKAKLNGMHLSRKQGNVMHGLFLTLSLVNHDCLANAAYDFSTERNVALLIASRAIFAGDEISFSYLGLLGGEKELYKMMHRREYTRKFYGFECNCRACCDKDLDRELVGMEVLFAEFSKMRKPVDVLWSGQKLIDIFDGEKITMGHLGYVEVYFRMFVYANARKHTTERALEFLQLAQQYALEAYFPESKMCLEHGKYLSDPTSHKFHFSRLNC